MIIVGPAVPEIRRRTVHSHSTFHPSNPITNPSHPSLRQQPYILAPKSFILSHMRIKIAQFTDFL